MYNLQNSTHPFKQHTNHNKTKTKNKHRTTPALVPFFFPFFSSPITNSKNA